MTKSLFKYYYKKKRVFSIYIRILLNKFFLTRFLLALIINFTNYPFGGYYNLITKLSRLDIWDNRLSKKVKPFNIDHGNGFNNYYGNLHTLNI